MTPLHTEENPGAMSPSLPELPEGWHYTDDLIWDDPRPSHGHRTLIVGLSTAAVVVIALAALVVWSAASHYARGVDALRAGSYTTAVNELSSAKLFVVPYRDSQILADQARYELVAAAAGQEKARARVSLVTGALDQARAALGAGSADGVVKALSPLRAADVRAASRDSASVQTAAVALSERLAAAAEQALGRSEWARAGRFAAALLVLRPSTKSAKALAARAQTGAELAARLAKAKKAAHHGRWREALRLALAVTAVRKDFPGAASLVTQARKALAPKPKPKPVVTTAATPAATTTTPSGGGSSSNTPSQPPPP